MAKAFDLSAHSTLMHTYVIFVRAMLSDRLKTYSFINASYILGGHWGQKVWPGVAVAFSSKESNHFFSFKKLFISQFYFT